LRWCCSVILLFIARLHDECTGAAAGIEPALDHIGQQHAGSNGVDGGGG
jgi:hypothetical protein